MWDQTKPLEPWVSRIITNQIRNLIRNNYTNYVSSYPKIDKFNPFGTDVPYSIAVHGASISTPPYQYLTTPANYAGVQLGSSDFTLEFWIYTPNNGGDAETPGGN
jgi:hypothetical protein